MKLGLLLFILGSILILSLIKIKFEKEILTRIGIIIGILMLLYGLVLVLQPNEDNYVKFTKSTISKDKNETK